MKKFILILCLLLAKIIFSQTIPANSQLVSDDMVAKLFTEKVKTDFGIDIPIYKVFEYKDKAGLHYLTLMESEYSKNEDSPLFDKIKLVDVLSTNGILKTNWTVTDFLKTEDVKNDPYFSIWIWTKFLQINDIDGDGISDPIIVYGIRSKNNVDEGKIKIITIHKGKKYAIHHQNSGMDSGRNTQVDKSFYTLPIKIQNKVKEIMTKIAENGNGIFPYGWQKNLKLKKLKFDENY